MLCEGSFVRRARGDLVQVELVEDEPDDRLRDGTGVHALQTVVRWARGHRWPLLVGVVVVALAVGGVQWGRAVARQGPAPSGLVPDLTEARHELWRVKADWLAGQIGTVVVAGFDTTTVGLDADTGVQRWSSEQFGWCWLTDGTHVTGQNYSSQASLVEDPRLVVCSDTSGGLVSVDPVDGTVMARLTQTDDTAMLVTVDDLLLEIDLRLPRAVTAVSITDGAKLWTRELKDPAYAWFVAGDSLVLPGPSGVVALDLHSGADAKGAAPWVVASVPLDGGGQVRAQVEADGTVRTVALGEAGNQLWATGGRLITPDLGVPVTSDTAVVLTSAGSLLALDTRTGQQAWQQAAGSHPALAMDGVLALQANTADGNVQLVAMDIATGEQLWSAPLGAWLWAPSVLCDGTHVGVVEGADANQTLVVRDLRSGKVVASWPLPGSGSSMALPLPGGRVAQVTGVPSQHGVGRPADTVPGVVPEVIVLGP